MGGTACRFGVVSVTALVVLASLMPAAQGIPPVQQPRVAKAVAHDTSRPLREIVRPLTDAPVRDVGPPREIPRFDNPRVRERYLRQNRAQPVTADPLRQGARLQAPAPEPMITFDGPSADDGADTPGAGRVVPPDPVGDVGPNHWISMVNIVTTIYTKDGSAVLGPFANNDLWDGFGGPCEDENNGDPIVLYDQLADRWMLSQMAIDFGLQCVAVSTGPDPTDTYHRYAFPVSPGNNDYPKLGLWPDAYYLSFNEFTPEIPDGQPAFCAFEREAMLEGDAAQLVCFPIAPLPNGDEFWIPQPATLEGMTPPPAGAPNPFIMAFDDEVWGGDPDPTQDFYKVWHFAVDWNDLGSSTLTGPIDVPTVEFNSNQCGIFTSRSCVPQPDTTDMIDSLALFNMYRAVYRNFGDEHVDGAHESLWLNHTVNVDGSGPPGLAGVRWTEVRDPIGSPVEHQGATWSPDDGEHRFMGSLSVDDAGNMLLAYSLSSESTYPSIRYAGRLVTDPLGELSQDEATLWAGTGSQLESGNRWGDYSSVSLDETDGCSFWITNEYYEETTSFDWKTRVGATQYPSCVAAEVGTIAGMVTEVGTGDPIVGATITVENGDGDLFESNTDEEGHYAILVPAGTYDVTASAFGFIMATAPDVVVTDEDTTTLDFQLEAAAMIDLDGFVTDGSGAGWPLYASVTITAEGADPLRLHTDPTNGHYLADGLFAGTAYTFTVVAIAPDGYVPEERTITTGDADSQENFALVVDASCSTPGYTFGAPLLAEDFEDTFPPDGWEVTHGTEGCEGAEGHPAWNTENLAGRENLTGGSGAFAIADADACESGVSMRTDMATPAIDLSDFGGADTIRLAWNHDYNDLDSVAQVQAWDGTAWITVADFSGADDRGPVRREAVTTIGLGSPDARFRWHYDAGWDWWWEVDDVEIRVGSCAYQGAGLIYGHVSDANTNEPINGALVEVDTGEVATTVATPDDPNLDDGFYSVSVPLSSQRQPGLRTLTVTADGYLEQSRQVVPTPGSSQREDVELPAGLLTVAPEALRARVPVGGAASQALTLSNVGTADLGFGVVELNIPPPPEAPEEGWPQEVPLLAMALPDKDEIPLTAEGIPDVLNGRPTLPKATLESAGQWLNQFPTGLAYGYGAGWYPGRNTLWLSNIAAAGGDDVCYEYTSDGTLTGNTIDCDFGGSFPGGLTYNPTTETLWVNNVGGDGCLHEIDPVALEQTGNTICGPWTAAQYGVAYDPASDTYYVSGFVDQTIWQVEPDGTLVRSVVTGLSALGLAYNPIKQQLFVLTSAAPTLVHVLDATDPELAEIDALALLDEQGNPAHGDFEGAGVAFDCGGALVSVNQITQTVYVNTSGDLTPLCEVDIPWFEADPASGLLAAGASSTVAGQFSALGIAPRCEEAHVRIANDTPYGPAIVPVGLTVAYGDVAATRRADPYIHGLATAQISLGCGPGLFCPDGQLLRNVAAVWLTRAAYGVDFPVPPATGLVFEDVAAETFGADEIELLANEGVITGCSASPSRFCPNAPLTRAQLAVWQLRALEGADYVPPACSGIFSDVPCPATPEFPFADWIEDLYSREPAVACADDPLRFCPNALIRRGGAAIFTGGTFDLPVCRQ